MPSIGYGSNKKTRHMLPDGFRKFLVHNVAVSFLLYVMNLNWLFAVVKPVRQFGHAMQIFLCL